MKKAFGIDKWDVLPMLKNTHGVDFDDYIWLRFKGEVLKWEDVKVRD